MPGPNFFIVFGLGKKKLCELPGYRALTKKGRGHKAISSSSFISGKYPYLLLQGFRDSDLMICFCKKITHSRRGETDCWKKPFLCPE
jgi:hypothetical protein